MKLHPHHLQCFFLLILPPITLGDSNSTPRDHYLINCGNPTDVAGWRTDEGSFTTSTPTATMTTTAPPPYDSARVFWSPLTYSIHLSSPGSKLIRLYFSTTMSFNKTTPEQFAVSLTANEFILLSNFSPYLAVANAQTHQNTNAPVPQGRLVKEFYITVGEISTPLSLTFSSDPPSSVSNSQARSYGFINGIEVISVPNGLYVPVDTTSQSTSIPYLIGGPNDYASISFNNFTESMAMETMIRVNVGGSDVQPSADSGLNRTWYQDANFIGDFKGYIPSHYIVMDIQYTNTTPAYTAPTAVYGTVRIMGPYPPEFKLSKNLTWVFEVDAGFNYLVRLHFCQLETNVTQSSQLQFNIYINGQMAQSMLDAFDFMGGAPGTPKYKDFVAYVDDNGGGGGGTTNVTNRSRVHLSVALHPIETLLTDAFLNGLEIFKLNNSDGSLAALNPDLSTSRPTNPPNFVTTSQHHHLVPILVGVAVGLVLLSLVALTFFFIYGGKEKEEGSAPIVWSRKSSGTKRTPINSDNYRSSTATTSSTTSTSVASSLPSDLCRRFSLAQIRTATCDFDDSAVIGSGGFGNVYKGSIDNGAALVAVKRLSSTSNQGGHEFRNEIEMLSRLRHLHLVSLIGYCEDQGEMILVYEYMPHGTLRDHLVYQNNVRNNDSTPLSWKQRLTICVGSARGLHYLHSGAKQPIIHRDVKSANILLDGKWTAKVSDFGLSKVGPATGVGHVSTAVKGSIGYLDPEYCRLRQLTEKSDVYSFGVVLFEVLCGRPAINPHLPKDQVNLALWARSHQKKGTLGTIVDPNLAGQIAPESLRKFGEAAEMCVRDHGSERPSMADVVWALEFALQIQLTADRRIRGGSNGGDHDVTTATEVVATTGDNLSQSSPSVGDRGTVKFSDIPRAASYSDIDVVDLTPSGSVFSEIIHPGGR